MRTALDTNVLSALWNKEPTAESLTAMLGAAAEAGSVVLCAAVYAELVARPQSTEESVWRFITDTRIVVDFELTEEVWVEAGRAFRRYSERRARSGAGPALRLLADFIIGAHALVMADRLMTLDRGRYERDFPQLKLI